MTGRIKTKEQLLNELDKPRQRISIRDRSAIKGKQIEETLRERENYYATLVENLPQKIFLKDKNSVYLSCNENYSRDLKIRPDEITGKTDYDFYPKELAKKYQADDKRIMESGKTEDIEERYIQDGKEVIVHTVKTPIKDKKCKTIGILGIFWDITERKHVEDDLRKYREQLEEMIEKRTAQLRMVNEQLQQEITVRIHTEEVLREYQRAIEGSQDIIAVVDQNYNYLLANKAFLKYRGMDREQIIGRSVAGVLGKDVFEGVVKKYLDTCFQGEVVRYEMKYTYPEFGQRDLLVSYFPIEGPSGVNRVASVIQDITERKRTENALRESEKRYRALFEGSRDAIYITAREGEIVDANQSMIDLFGYSREEIIGLNARKTYVNPEDRKKFQEKIEREGFVRDYEIKLRKKNGSEMECLLTATVRWANDGNIVGYQGILRDITERKQVLNELHTEKRRFQTLSENAPFGMVMIDKDGAFRYINPKFRELFGYDLNDVPNGKAWFRKAYPDTSYRHNVISTWVNDLESSNPGEKRPRTFTVTCKDGTEKIINFIPVQLERSENLMACEDITERRQVEEALCKSEERFRELYDNAPVGYHEYDSEGRITNVNLTDLEMLGYTREEMVGQPIWKFNVNEETVREQVMAKLAGTLPPGKELERIYRRKDGTTFPVLIEDRLILDENRRIKGIRCTIQDITERERVEEALRKSEEKFQKLFDKAPMGYMELNAQGCITQVNRTELTMLGYTAEEMLEQPIWKFVVEEEKARQTVIAKLSESIREPWEALERNYKRKDGTTLTVLIKDALTRDAEGKVTGIYSTIQDITERKQMEQEKKNLEEQLRQSQRIEAIGRLAGGIAHDFNNLLTVIKGYTQLSLLGLKEGDPLKGSLEEIQKSSERAADLTHQLLAFSRRQMLEFKVLDLNAVLRNLDKMLRRVLGEDVKLVTLLAEDLGRVKADPGQMEQVVMNLAVNARDAMPSGGRLTIETANVQLDEAYARAHISVSPGCYVVLSVSDTGVGMTQEVKERVFEPFFTTKEISKGTGLGLSTVYGIVKQSGGNIWVYSEPGKGTTFKIYLQRVDEPLEELREKMVGEELPRGKETVLVVEDDEKVRKLIVEILGRQGYRVLEASHGDEALLIHETHDGLIPLILVDVVMPGMSGSELAKRIASLRPEIKILYMSGYTDNAIVHHGVLAGGLNYIQKPFTMDGLTRKVREVLDKDSKPPG
jgi:PAS domain S-box-containing protein